jgi:hypothetical protein
LTGDLVGNECGQFLLVPLPDIPQLVGVVAGDAPLRAEHAARVAQRADALYGVDDGA